jgi:hypothetical protein
MEQIKTTLCCLSCGMPLTKPLDCEDTISCSNCGATFLKHLLERNDFAYEQQEAKPQ